LTETATEPAKARQRRGDGGGGQRWSVAAVGGRGGLHEAIVVGCSAEVGDVLLGDHEAEVGMHGGTSGWDLVRAP
jgi:hypothetical protein